MMQKAPRIGQRVRFHYRDHGLVTGTVIEIWPERGLPESEWPVTVRMDDWWCYGHARRAYPRVDELLLVLPASSAS
jgi:hypothetical protein